MDVLSSTKSGSSIAWYENYGKGEFGSQEVIIFGVQDPDFIHTDDLDGDGDEDLIMVLTPFNNHKITWYENIGSGEFGSQQIITSEVESPESVFTEDLDGDGDMDLLSASANDNKIAWYENDGKGVFGTQQIIDNQAIDTRAVTAVDIDGDDDIDVLSSFLNDNFNDNRIIWYENDGTASFSSQHLVTDEVDGIVARGIFATDLDEDNDIDVLSASRDNNKIVWYKNDGAGNFGPQIVITNSLLTPISVYADDVDGDGVNDVLSASNDDDKIAWYKNDGTGDFGNQQIITTKTDGARYVFTADLDLDGDNDVLSASSYDDKIAWYRQLEPILSVITDTISVTPIGGQNTVDIENEGVGSLNWNATITNGDWITLNSRSGQDENEDLLFSYEANSEAEVRTAVIKLVAQEARNSPLNVVVKQKAATFKVDTTFKNVDYVEGAINFNVIKEGAGSLEWNASVISGEWAVVMNETGSEEDELTVYYDNNTTTAKRNAEIAVDADNVVGGPITLTIEQAPIELDVELNEVLTDTIHPSFVNVLFQATDPFGNGIPFLDEENPEVIVDGEPKSNFFTLTEEGQEIRPGDSESDFRILKQNAIGFELNTALVLDQSSSIGFENLSDVKDAAISLVRDIGENQRIGLYTFTSSVQQVESFTSDTTVLINAIEDIELAGGSTNLFGGVVDAAEDVSPLITTGLDEIVRGNIVVFTDGQENAGQYTLGEVQSATSGMDVFAIGVGEDVDQDELQDITGFSDRVFQADEPSQLTREFRDLQQDIANLANSFYWISYITPRRFGTNNITLTVDGNENTSSSGILETQFSAEDFGDVLPQIVVNQRFPDVFGVDTVRVPVSKGDTTVSAISLLSGNTPKYSWESSDENTIAIAIANLAVNGEMVKMEAVGLEGQYANVVVTDTANSDFQGNDLKKELVVIIGDQQNDNIESFTIEAGETGSFSFEDSGVEVDINENNGDEFTLSLLMQENPDGELPENVISFLGDMFWSFDLNTEGKADIEYSVNLSLSSLFDYETDRITALYRSDRASPWINLADSSKIELLIEDEVLKISGMTSFSDFVLAEYMGPTDIRVQDEAPHSFTIYQNYPNPFNPTTQIIFDLPQASKVTLEVYDMVGRKISTLVDERRSAGRHTSTFNAENLSTGIYIYRIQAGDFLQTKKMMLIK